MVNVDTVIKVNRQKVVPVRAIPFITGGAIGPMAIAQLLADPDQGVTAHLVNIGRCSTPMQPREWKVVQQRLDCLPARNVNLAETSTLAVIPSGTYIHVESLHRLYEHNYLDREDAHEMSSMERFDLQLFFEANIPQDLIEFVFAGFSRPTAKAAIVTTPPEQTPLQTQPVSRLKAQDDQIISKIIALGLDPKRLQKNMQGKSGVKADIRAALGDKGIWAGTTVFDKAWERLRKMGDIIDKQ